MQNSGKVILIFSVNMSGFFQGYAQMMSSVGWRRDNVWSQGNGKNNPWGRSFKVKWLRLNTLPFQKTLHLKNPLNDYKPVKISRDCQVSIYCILVFPFYSYPCKLKCSSILCLCLCILPRNYPKILGKLSVTFLMERMMWTAFRQGIFILHTE